MSKFLIGVDGTAHEVSRMYIGVDGVAHKVKAAYIGVDGQARLFFGGYYMPENNEVVVNLTSGQYYNADTLFSPGVYQIDIAAEPTHYSSSTYYNNGFTIQTTMTQPFKIFGLLSASSLNDFITNLGVDGVGTIFGGKGGKSAGSGGVTSGPFSSGVLTWGGACCHFLPANGTFGTNYLRCFHCGAPASPSSSSSMGASFAQGAFGGSGAYGGGCGGRGSRSLTRVGSNWVHNNYTGASGVAGIGGAGGAGGTGTISGNYGSSWGGKPGTAGSGIGGGTEYYGGIAWYNGSTWASPTRNSTVTQSLIKVTYLRRS